MAEVLAINALAPAVINGKLRAFMEASATAPLVRYDEESATPASHTMRFIVNVSAMEGRFYKVRLCGIATEWRPSCAACRLRGSPSSARADGQCFCKLPGPSAAAC